MNTIEVAILLGSFNVYVTYLRVIREEIYKSLTHVILKSWYVNQKVNSS